MSPEPPVASDSARMRQQAKDMGDRARLVAAHIDFRNSLDPAGRPEADAAFMVRLAGSDQRFWKLVDRAFVCAAGAMDLGAKVVEDAERLRRRPGSGPSP